jgi:hypothetical protein
MEVTALRIVIPDEGLVEFHPTKENSPLPIWIRFNDHCYPQQGWIDAGALILSWWADSLTSLSLRKRVTELSFMEGPYRVLVREHGAEWYLMTTPEENVNYVVKRSEVHSELVSALVRVRARIADVSGRERLVSYYDKLVERLRKM